MGANLDYSDPIGEDEVHPPNILHIEDAEEILDTRQLKLRDMYFQDKQGFVKWTISITDLKPGCQTRGHSHPDHQEMCRIVKGDGICMLDHVSHRVKTGTYILIPVQVRHKLINISGSEDLVAIHDFPSHIARSGFVRRKR